MSFIFGAHISILCFMLIICNSASNGAGCLDAERKALFQFKKGLNDPKNFLSSWQGLDCCRWYGIVCDNQTGDVLSINLHNQYACENDSDWAISGTIYPSLLQLKSLISLDLSCNDFRGIPIPAFIGSLEHLVYLNLSEAGFSGSIPSQLGNLSSLQFLDLSNNDLNLSDDFKWISRLSSLIDLILSGNILSGTLPPNLGQLRNLQVLDLSDNSIQGSIPLSFCNLSQLTDLILRGNNLSGTLPPNLWQLTKLVDFDVSLNHMTGIVTEHFLSKLSDLKYLLMSSNSFTINISTSWLPPFQLEKLGLNSCQIGSRLPSWLQNQTELEFLDLSNTGISGKIPTWFWNVSNNLGLLDISFNKIEGQLPNFLPIGNLANVDMRSNLLTGSLPTDLSSMITTLFLSDNQFSGPIPPSFCYSQVKMVYLSLSNNNLSGQIPTSMGEILSLEVLDLSRNKLNGSIPESLQNLTELEALALEYNSLSGSIPPYIGSFQNLQTLHLGHNQLSGSIPPSLQNCSSLQTLDLGGNLLDGFIPSWFAWSLPELRILGLRYNKFSGQLPPQLSNMSSLQVLDLAHNYFEGPIPLSFGNFKAMTSSPKVNQKLLVGNYYQEHFSMQYSSTDKELVFSNTLSLVISIDLSRNKLSGHFPVTMTKLAGLLILDLSDNRLNGEIPRDISALQGLLSLDLSNNGFSGSIPASLSSMTFLNHLNLSNNDFNGSIPAGGQLLTFDESSYTGNEHLCGPPLNVECSLAHGNGTDHRAADYGHTEEDVLQERLPLLGVGLGFAVGLLGLFAVISIRQQWSVAYFNAIDLFILWISKVMNRFWCVSNGGRKKPKRRRNRS